MKNETKEVAHIGNTNIVVAFHISATEDKDAVLALLPSHFVAKKCISRDGMLLLELDTMTLDGDFAITNCACGCGNQAIRYANSRFHKFIRNCETSGRTCAGYAAHDVINNGCVSYNHAQGDDSFSRLGVLLALTYNGKEGV